MRRIIFIACTTLALGLTSCLSPKKTVATIKGAATMYKASKEIIGKKWTEQKDSLATEPALTETPSGTPEN